MSNQNKALYWPYAIVISILIIVGASVATIMVALENPVEMSDHNLQDYHTYDNDVNKFIVSKIRFDKHYDIAYVSEGLDQQDAIISYKVTDKDKNVVNDAKIEIMITHPGNHDHDIPLDDPSIKDGVYTFKAGRLPNPGRWNLIAHVVIDEHERYYNLKADTRQPNAFEY